MNAKEPEEPKIAPISLPKIEVSTVPVLKTNISVGQISNKIDVKEVPLTTSVQ